MKVLQKATNRLAFILIKKKTIFIDLPASHSFSHSGLTLKKSTF
jgi:hypothetical protein